MLCTYYNLYATELNYVVITRDIDNNHQCCVCILIESL